jgi:hypothetical protein
MENLDALPWAEAKRPDAPLDYPPDAPLKDLPDRELPGVSDANPIAINADPHKTSIYETTRRIS